MSATTLSLILTWVGLFAEILCIGCLVYISETKKKIFRLDKTDFIGFMLSLCIVFAIAGLLDFNKYTIFNLNLWIVNVLLWEKTE